MSKSNIKEKLKRLEKRIAAKEGAITLTQQQIDNLFAVYLDIIDSVRFIAEREVLNSGQFTKEQQRAYDDISLRILDKLMEPPFNDPIKYAKENWPQNFEDGGIYDKMLRGEPLRCEVPQ